MKIPSSLYFEQVDTSRPFDPLRMAASTWLRVKPEPVRSQDLIATEAEIDRDRMRYAPGFTPNPPRVLCYEGKSYLVSDHAIVAQMLQAGREIIECVVVQVERKPASALTKVSRR